MAFAITQGDLSLDNLRRVSKKVGNLKKRISLLRARLKRLFGLQGNPILPFSETDKSYKTKFVIAHGAKEQPAEAASETHPEDEIEELYSDQPEDEDEDEEEESEPVEKPFKRDDHDEGTR
jgi:hypothetical protein